MSKYSSLFSPITIGGVKVKNRIMMPGMDTNYGSADGNVTEKLQAYLTERARGGTGLITIEATSVSYPEGRIGAFQLRLNDPIQTARWVDTIRSIHAFGAKVIVQLHHGGIQAVPAFSGGVENVCASEFHLHRAFNGRAMSTEEVLQLKKNFVACAVNAKRTGADGVEIHAAHMYLLNSFLSSFTNHRTDEYGGSLENRGRILREIIEEIRAALPHPFIISVRLPARDFVPGGQTIEEGMFFAKMCEDAGADLINVSTGFAFSAGMLTETQFEQEGNRLYFGEAMKKAVSIPVATVGKMRTAAFCNNAIESGKTDLVVVGRQLICDPAWANKNLFGHESQVRPCLSCNAACVSGYSTSNVQCVINPFVSHEMLTRESALLISGCPKKITVIGGGPAGLQFAAIAAKRGHDVQLIEKSEKLGGQMNLSSIPPHKELIADARDWFIHEAKRLGVTVKTGREYTCEELAENGSDYYVVATGAIQGIPPIPGIKHAKGSWTVLNGTEEVKAGMNVVIIGGGSVSCETAEFLIEKGCTVTVIELLPELMPGYELTHRLAILNALNGSGKFTSYCSARTKSIEADEVVLEAAGEEITIGADLVLYSTGNIPFGNELYDGLLALGCEAYKIGDAVSVGDLHTSTRSAYELAFSI